MWVPLVTAHVGTRCPRCHSRIEPVIVRFGSVASYIKEEYDSE